MADNHARHADESRRMHEARKNEAWTRGYGAPAHDPDPIEPPEIMANRGLFADSGGAYED